MSNPEMARRLAKWASPKKLRFVALVVSLLTWAAWWLWTTGLLLHPEWAYGLSVRPGGEVVRVVHPSIPPTVLLLLAGLSTALVLRYRRRWGVALALTSPLVVVPGAKATHATQAYAAGTAQLIAFANFGMGGGRRPGYRGLDPGTRIPLDTRGTGCSGPSLLWELEQRIHNGTLRLLVAAFGPMPGAYEDTLLSLPEWRRAMDDHGEPFPTGRPPVFVNSAGESRRLPPLYDWDRLGTILYRSDDAEHRFVVLRQRLAALEVCMPEPERGGLRCEIRVIDLDGGWFYGSFVYVRPGASSERS